MILPPSILHLRLSKATRPTLVLWLPLIFIWPVVVAAWLVALPLLLVGALLLWRTGVGRTILLGPIWLFILFCRARGLQVKVDDGRSGIKLRLL